jgi:hypothetical protein
MQSILFSQKNNILVHFMSLHTIKVEKMYKSWTTYAEPMYCVIGYYNYGKDNTVELARFETEDTASHFLKEMVNQLSITDETKNLYVDLDAVTEKVLNK